jgi:hypothetical protein
VAPVGRRRHHITTALVLSASRLRAVNTPGTLIERPEERAFVRGDPRHGGRSIKFWRISRPSRFRSETPCLSASWHLDEQGRKAPNFIPLADQELFGFAGCGFPRSKPRARRVGMMGVHPRFVR